jgi:uncharacterized protein
MVIRFTCTQCGNELEVPAASVGKRAKCPACSCLIQISEAPTSPQPQTESEVEQCQAFNDSSSVDGTLDQEIPQEATNQSGMPFTSNITGVDDRTLATLAHASGLIGMFTVGFLGFLGPLVIYLMYRETSAFVGNQAKEALNFQISLFLFSIAMLGVGMLTCGFAFPLLFIAPVVQIIFGIIAPIQVWSGDSYRYPLTLRLLK